MGSLTSSNWQSSGITHQGNVRDHNEDALLEMSRERLWVVADGMGGHSSGELASEAIVNALMSYSGTLLLGRNIAKIEQLLLDVNRDLIAKSGDDESTIIGSTVAALLIQGHYCVCLWAGDSRIYRFRNEKLTQITRDHNELDEQIDRGIPEEQAVRSPYAHSITRAVGGDEDLKLETQIVEIEETDIFLLCSDGLNKELSDQEIEEILGAHGPNSAVNILLTKALSKKGQDNITVLLTYSSPVSSD